MPLKVLSPINGANIYLWEITETTDELLKLNEIKNHPDIDKLRNVDHIKQTLAKNLILKKLELTQHLYKSHSGRPFLNNGLHISISHSGKWVAISVAKFPIGIDVEIPRKKLLKIATKFLSSSDSGALQLKTIEDLLWYWTGKESVYKLMDTPGLSLKKDILFTALDKKNLQGEARVKEEEKISLHYEKLADNSLICLSYFEKII
jgi:phosphopantetheinyl transferase